MEIEQAFEKVAPGSRNIGRFQYIIFSAICAVQIFLACQMCLLGTWFYLKKTVTHPMVQWVDMEALENKYHASLSCFLNFLGAVR